MGGPRLIYPRADVCGRRSSWRSGHERGAGNDARGAMLRQTCTQQAKERSTDKAAMKVEARRLIVQSFNAWTNVRGDASAIDGNSPSTKFGPRR